MILVDTSVWIDHFRAPEAELRDRLDAGEVLMHSMVIGEIACGNLSRRAQTLAHLRSLPHIPGSDHDEVMRTIESGRLMGRGLGYIDAHLVSSVLRHDDASLWTRDMRLKGVAEELGVAFLETPPDGKTSDDEEPREDLRVTDKDPT